MPSVIDATLRYAIADASHWVLRQLFQLSELERVILRVPPEGTPASVNRVDPYALANPPEMP